MAAKGTRSTQPEPTRLGEEQLAAIVLLSGSHDDRQDGLCLMEAVAWFAGEPHSDAPQCASPVIRKFGISWNDGIKDDAERTQLLKPFIARIVDTRASDDIEERRAFMAMDWIIRVHTPAWLDLKPDFASHAAALRALPEITATEYLVAAQPILNAARSAAAAAWDAARDAARDAAWDAARDAAWDAAYPVAYAAAMAIFKPVVAQLQASAVELFSRMIDCGRELLTKVNTQWRLDERPHQ